MGDIMELLAILFSEFVILFLAPILIILVLLLEPVFILIIALIEAIFTFLASLIFGIKPEQKHKNNLFPILSKITKWTRKVTYPILFISAIVISTLLILNYFFLEEVVRFASKQIKTGSEMNIEFDSAKGDLFLGQLQFSNIRVKHANKKTRFDLQAKNAEMKLDMFSLFSRTRHFYKAHIDGVTGSIINLKKKSKADQEPSKDKIKLKRHFIIEDLNITNLDISFGRLNQPPLLINFESVKSEGFKSRYAIFYTFFRSNIKGKINSRPFEIMTNNISGGRQTNFNIQNFPIADLSNYIDRAPLNWFQSGEVDIEAHDVWRNEIDTEINTKWRFVLKNPYIKPPEHLGTFTKTFLGYVANYINNKEEDVDLSFYVIMDKEKFNGTTSLDAAGLWKAVFNGYTKQLSEKIGVPTNKIKEESKKLYKGAKSLFNRFRKGEKAQKE